MSCQTVKDWDSNMAENKLEKKRKENQFQTFNLINIYINKLEQYKDNIQNKTLFRLRII